MIRPRSYDFKLIIVGDSHVGKTTILNKYIGGAGIENNDFVRHTVKKDGKGIILQIHDTKDQERFRSLTTSYYRGADGCMVCFNVMRIDSFESLEGWLEDVNHYTERDIPKILVGLDCSKASRSRRPSESNRDQMVPNLKIESLCEEFKLQYVTVDISNKTQIENAFATIVEIMVEERKKRYPSVPDIIIHVPWTEDNKKDSKCHC